MGQILYELSLVTSTWRPFSVETRVVQGIRQHLYLQDELSDYSVDILVEILAEINTKNNNLNSSSYIIVLHKLTQVYSHYPCESP